MPTSHQTCLAVAGFLSLLGASLAHAQMHGAHDGPTMNHHRVDDRLATGGHFVDDGMDAVKKQGVTVIVDLRDEPPTGQEAKLAKAGIEWINVPVVWKDPRPEDFERFVEVMNEHADDSVLVQCQANYRASAMTYLYRFLVQEVSEDEARADLNAVWEPEGRWKDYMDGIIRDWSQ